LHATGNVSKVVDAPFAAIAAAPPEPTSITGWIASELVAFSTLGAVVAWI
jgi:hypothetical protein